MLLYTTGDESGISMPDKGEAFEGLLPAPIQEQIRRDEGALEKGQEYERIKAAGEAERRRIADEQGPIA